MIRAVIILTLFFRPIYSELALFISLLLVLLMLLLSSLSVLIKILRLIKNIH
ncbi:hypothetical protein J5U23_00240 [Saccharolobus shibatae B12]|uniref:Uncharacterized protein n=2 Tax=Saccharolobus shibatae TaxID=2286 RepID=A0A8F5GY46_9CREN|nr:hypothetical protein J5U23_00240 [Saccharolobus shibatae B12]QXJ30678.1 hypothetical protein J5U21_00327 [Saccharolobus shibatae]QXJ33706.1 hypothetical protein J5U22_00251 [Saccharolobus shibatae]